MCFLAPAGSAGSTRVRPARATDGGMRGVRRLLKRPRSPLEQGRLVRRARPGSSSPSREERRSSPRCGLNRRRRGRRRSERETHRGSCLPAPLPSPRVPVPSKPVRVRIRLRFCLRCCTRTEGENEQPDIRERSIRWWGRGRDDPVAYLVLSGPRAPARTDRRTTHSLPLTQARAPSESRAKSAVVKRSSGQVGKRVKSTGSSGARSVGAHRRTAGARRTAEQQRPSCSSAERSEGARGQHREREQERANGA